MGKRINNQAENDWSSYEWILHIPIDFCMFISAVHKFQNCATDQYDMQACQ